MDTVTTNAGVRERVHAWRRDKGESQRAALPSREREPSAQWTSTAAR